MRERHTTIGNAKGNEETKGPLLESILDGEADKDENNTSGAKNEPDAVLKSLLDGQMDEEIKAEVLVGGAVELKGDKTEDNKEGIVSELLSELVDKVVSMGMGKM